MNIIGMEIITSTLTINLRPANSESAGDFLTGGNDLIVQYQDHVKIS